MFALNFVDIQKICLSWGLALDGSPNTSKGHKSFFIFPKDPQGPSNGRGPEPV